MISSIFAELDRMHERLLTKKEANSLRVRLLGRVERGALPRSVYNGLINDIKENTEK